MDVACHDFSDIISIELISNVVAVCVEADSQKGLADGRVADGRGVGSSCTNARYCINLCVTQYGMCLRVQGAVNWQDFRRSKRSPGQCKAPAQASNEGCRAAQRGNEICARAHLSK